MLAPHATAIKSLQIILRMRRDMSGAELDRAAASVLASVELEVERRRRAEWRQRELSASSFERDTKDLICGHWSGKITSCLPCSRNTPKVPIRFEVGGRALPFPPLAHSTARAAKCKPRIVLGRERLRCVSLVGAHLPSISSHRSASHCQCAMCAEPEWSCPAARQIRSNLSFTHLNAGAAGL